MTEPRLCRECGKPLFARKPRQSLASFSATKMHPTCAAIRAERALKARSALQKQEREAAYNSNPEPSEVAFDILRAIQRVYGNVYSEYFPRRFDEVEMKIERGEIP
jgi:hypothetical protein